MTGELLDGSRLPAEECIIDETIHRVAELKTSLEGLVGYLKISSPNSVALLIANTALSHMDYVEHAVKGVPPALRNSLSPGQTP